MKEPIRWILTVLLLPIAAVSCGDGSTQPEAPRPARVSLTPPATTFSWLGDSRQLLAQVLDQNGTVIPTASVSWVSADPSVASVSEDGIVTATGPGQVSITASSGSVSRTASILVVQAPSSLAKISGDAQIEQVGADLPEALVVEVRDQGGAPVPEASVRWRVESGGGILMTEGRTDASGRSEALWTLGTLVGEQSASASASSARVDFTVEATAPEEGDFFVESVSPFPIREGAQAVVSGTGLLGATVDVGGTVAELIGSSSSEITFLVPISDCRPSRETTVGVALTDQSASITTTVIPQVILDPLDLGGGWLDRGDDEEGHCLHLAETEGEVTYLIGVQSLSETVEDLIPVGFKMGTGALGPSPVTGSASGHEAGYRALPAPTTLAPVASRPPSAPGGGQRVTPSPVRIRHAEEHLRRWARDEQMVRRLRESPGWGVSARPGPAAQAPPSIGEEVVVRVPNTCTEFETITTIVKAVGEGSIWLEDVANPDDGFSDDDYQAMSSLYDTQIADPLDEFAGSATDLDANGRIVVVVSREVNDAEGVLGFISSADLFSNASCPASNEGEYFYGIAPDPAGATSSPTSVQEALALYPALIAHEVTHIIHVSRQLYLVGVEDFPRTWELEGFATFMEELVGHQVTGLGSGQDLGFTEWFANQDWYGDFVFDLVAYFGFDFVSSKIVGTPQECSWLDRPPNGPCVNDVRLVYGVPASLFRWMADQYFTPATESQMTRGLADTPVHGLALLSDLVGEDLDVLLARWAGALVVDGTYLADGPLSFSSWDFGSLYEGLIPAARPQPSPRGHSFDENFGVRGGSTAYFLVNGSHGQISFGAPDLPTEMRLWVARIE